MIRTVKRNMTFLVPESDEENKEGLNNYRLQPGEAQLIYGDTITTANMGPQWEDTDNLKLDFYKGGEVVHSMTVPVRSNQQYSFPGAEYVVESIQNDKLRHSSKLQFGGILRKVVKTLQAKPVMTAVKKSRHVAAPFAHVTHERPFYIMQKRLHYHNKLKEAQTQLALMKQVRASQADIDSHIDYMESLLKQLNLYKRGGKILFLQEGGKTPWYQFDVSALKGENASDSWAYDYQKWKDEHPFLDVGVDLALMVGAASGFASPVAVPLLAAKAAADLGTKAYTRGEIDIFDVAGLAGGSGAVAARLGKFGKAADSVNKVSKASKLADSIKSSKAFNAINNSKVANAVKPTFQSVQGGLSKVAKGATKYSRKAGPGVEEAATKVSSAYKAYIRTKKLGTPQQVKAAKESLKRAKDELNRAKYGGRFSGTRMSNTGRALINTADKWTARPIRGLFKSNRLYKTAGDSSVATQKRLRRLAGAASIDASHVPSMFIGGEE